MTGCERRSTNAKQQKNNSDKLSLEVAHAAGMDIGAGAVDRAVQRMSPDELTELRRLLQSELRRSGD